MSFKRVNLALSNSGHKMMQFQAWSDGVKGGVLALSADRNAWCDIADSGVASVRWKILFS